MESEKNKVNKKTTTTKVAFSFIAARPGCDRQGEGGGGGFPGGSANAGLPGQGIFAPAQKHGNNTELFTLRSAFFRPTSRGNIMCPDCVELV